MKHTGHEVHPWQIPTTLKTIRSEFWLTGQTAVKLLLESIADAPGCPEQTNRVIAAAAIFHRISCLVYRGRDGRFRKPAADTYAKKIFDSVAETPEEVFDRLLHRGVTPEDAERIWKIARKTAELICPMMACAGEQAFVYEYAYAIDYVIRHGGDLPRPEIKTLFPTNYHDFKYGEGIAKTIMKYGLL